MKYVFFIDGSEQNNIKNKVYVTLNPKHILTAYAAVARIYKLKDLDALIDVYVNWEMKFRESDDVVYETDDYSYYDGMYNKFQKWVSKNTERVSIVDKITKDEYLVYVKAIAKSNGVSEEQVISSVENARKINFSLLNAMGN